MNYSNIYFQIIDKARTRDYISNKYKIGSIQSNQYTEVHHITPKCMGGTNSKSNLIVLTAKEHFVCHHLLCRMYPDNNRINTAFVIMLNRTKNKTAKNYDLYRKKLSKARRGTKLSDETKRKLSESMQVMGKETWYRDKVSKGVKNALETTNLREKIGAGVKKKFEDVEYKKRFSESMLKQWDNEDRRKKLSETVKKQNRDNPEIAKKRSNAIKTHQEHKSEEWKLKCGKWSKEYMNRSEIKAIYSEKYKGGKNPMARKVIDISTNIIYNTAVDAAKALNLNVSTLKKWMYKKIPKNNCLWLGDFLKIKEVG